MIQETLHALAAWVLGMSLSVLPWMAHALAADRRERVRAEAVRRHRAGHAADLRRRGPGAA
ncbi:hypothetical protein [Actinocorallia populi]|uniref:hypothetical protein n=1 Tax=Actinocorallia populi TaxID=2079200 RepID=UPI000D093A4C|nr:hypothetical protein [Actinocorallia populi]